MTASGTIHETLKSVFGFDSFREGQEAVISKIIDGNSALAIFPTGSGKSLCYQLPALHLDGLTLVISPLIALMKDQIDFLHGRGVAAARLDSSVPIEEFRRIDAELRAGDLKLLYVAPERLSNERFLAKLNGLKIALMVIDEAHCISEWGHNFRPDYLKLARLSRKLAAERVLTLTATATPEVAQDICREFAIADDACVHTGFYRPNLELQITPCPADDRIHLLMDRLRKRPRGATIVYVTLQRTAEAVAEGLSAGGLPARAYHAGLASEDRDAVQDWFMQSGDAIVVATIAFGMGIDKSGIRYVYHFNLPKSLENYSQEIGRAGRDGEPSMCEMLACADDIIVLENFTYGDTPEPAAIDAMVDSVLGHDGEFDVSIYELSRQHDVRPLVATTLLAYLELDDVIEVTAPFYTEYKFQPLKPSQEILARFDADRATFLRSLFACAVKARTWFHIDLIAAGRRLDAPRERIVKALTYLEEHGDLIVAVAGLRHGYRIKQRPSDTTALKQSLAGRFEKRERNDILRVGQVVALVEDSGCIVRRLLAHFGEDLPGDCGHCGVCNGRPASLIPRRHVPAIELSHGAIDELRRQHSGALGSPRQIARFLCGLTSPRITAAKLGKHPRFGSLAEIPFRAVMNAAAR